MSKTAHSRAAQHMIVNFQRSVAETLAWCAGSSIRAGAHNKKNKFVAQLDARREHSGELHDMNSSWSKAH